MPLNGGTAQPGPTQSYNRVVIHSRPDVTSPTPGNAAARADATREGGPARAGCSSTTSPTAPPAGSSRRSSSTRSTRIPDRGENRPRAPRASSPPLDSRRFVGAISEPPSVCEAARHNTLDAYANHRCRCPQARAEQARANKHYRWRRARGASLFIPAVGTSRRIRAMQALGWTAAELGQRLGGSSASAVNLLARRDRVHVNTARNVAALYDDLSMTLGPSEQERRHARARGWPGPLAWDDESIDDPTAKPTRLRLAKKREAPDPVAVERALAGEQLPLWPADQLEVARRILAAGGGANQVAKTLRMSGTYARRLVEQVAS